MARNQLRAPEMRERHARIVALTKAGHTARQIAEAVGVHIRTVTRVRTAHGVAQPGPRHFTPAEIAAVEAMLDDGVSYAEVARTLGRYPGTLIERWPGRSQWTAAGSRKMRDYLAALAAL